MLMRKYKIVFLTLALQALLLQIVLANWLTARVKQSLPLNKINVFMIFLFNNIIAHEPNWIR